MENIEKIEVICLTEEFLPEATGLAKKLSCGLLKQEPEEKDVETTYLCYSETGLSIEKDGKRMTGDFSGMSKRLLHNNLTHELLVKASKFRNIGVAGMVAVDATAGMGEDSLLLAAAGFRVIMFERDPVICALLRDTLRREKDNADISEIVSRMELREGNSVAALEAMENTEKPDVVFLDPMFPEKTKNSLTKKKFQLIHTLEKPADDEEELLQAAKKACPRRIIIKRPVKGPYLAGEKPSYSLEGKVVRYDIIVLNERI